MRLFILSLIFILLSSTFSVAVHSPVNIGDKTSTHDNIDNESGFSVLMKSIKTWVKSSYNKTKEFIKKQFSEIDDDLLLKILVFALPFLAMYIYEGKTWTNRVTIALIGTIICWIPGIIYTAIIIFGKK